MKPTVQFVSGLILIFLVTPILLLHGCGNSSSGAPAVLTVYESCENWMNDTDVFSTAPASETRSISGTGFVGGSIDFAPLLYVVSDAQGNPRNGVCVSFSTDGTFFLDRDHTLPISHTGALTNITLRTDDFGAIYVYWATEDLPPPPAAGADDETGETFVTATSGSRTHDFTVNWTITAPPAP